MAKGGTSVVKWEEQLAKDAKMATSAVVGVGVGNFIGTRGGIMTYAGSPLKDNQMDGVVLDHLFVKAYYEGDFDADNPDSPVCYAYGQVLPDGTMPDMKPHPNSTSPQNPTCEGCRWNAFKTDKRKKGKACKDTRRLAVIHADALKAPDTLPKTPVAFFSVPVTSVAGWANYVRSLAEVMKRPPYAVVTKMKLVPDAKTQFKAVFDLVDKVANSALLAPLRALHLRMATDIVFPYPERGSEKPGKSSGGGGGGGSKKFVGKKKVK